MDDIHPAYSALLDAARKWQRLTAHLGLPVHASIVDVLDAARKENDLGLSMDKLEKLTNRARLKFDEAINAGLDDDKIMAICERLAGAFPLITSTDVEDAIREIMTGEVVA